MKMYLEMLLLFITLENYRWLNHLISTVVLASKGKLQIDNYIDHFCFVNRNTQ